MRSKCRRAGHFMVNVIGDRRFEGIEFAGARPCRRTLRRRVQIFPDGMPAHAEMAFDLTDRPSLGPVQSVQVVDLFAREHGAIPLSGRNGQYQQVVVCKIPTRSLAAGEVLPVPRLAPELSCCLQDPRPAPKARPLQPNALGPKLSCCLQDRAAAVSDPELAAVGGYARRWLDLLAVPPPVVGMAGPPFSGAILAHLPVFRVRGDLAGDFRNAVAAGSPTRCRPIDWAGTSRAGRPLTIATTPFDHTGVVPLKTDQGKSFRNYCRVATASSPWGLAGVPLYRETCQVRAPLALTTPPAELLSF